MGSDYSAIKADNEKRYGTDIGRIGPMLLAHRYAEREHFIFELLQNAEDAIRRRDGWMGPRVVSFALANTTLHASHFGAPFTEEDVRGICGIAESTKGLNAIGCFGIGFKSVYAFTDRPEIHSGDENFAIESFVWPVAIAPCAARPDETVFILPFCPGDTHARSEIAVGLQRLGPRALLFLRQIEEIAWTIENGATGLYLRDKSKPFGDNARRVVVIGQEHGVKDIVEENWLVFSREVRESAGLSAGYVEIAFTLNKGGDNQPLSVGLVDDSRLVVFFPTIVPTNLGFLVQGPFRTTPSRDNIPHDDLWNQYLVKETATLLVEALTLLKRFGLLDAGALLSLPLDQTKFGEGSMFAPLFDAVRDALEVEPLLPIFGGGYASAKRARLARTQELRELINPAQLAALFGEDEELFWLSEEITLDRTPELRQYLMGQLEVAEVTPEALLPKFTKTFLEQQSDEWIVRLYAFLNGQIALLRRLKDVPLIRLAYPSINESIVPELCPACLFLFSFFV